MSLSVELSKLQELHEAGTLTDKEFHEAKASLLNPPVDKPLASQPRDSRIDMWMKYQIVMAIIGLIVGAFILLIWLPNTIK